MFRWNWRPRRDWSLQNSIDVYGPSALFFLNMYYITGSFKSFELLYCNEDREGGQYLRAQPSIVCWQGQHTTLAAVGIVGLMFYLIGVPALYFYVLFVRLKKRGLDDKRNMALFGFLYSRFEPQYYWWEITEVAKKAVLVIASTWLEKTVFLQCSMLIVIFGLNVGLTIRHSPFRTDMHDVTDVVTSFTQIMLLGAGVGIVLRTESAGSKSADEDTLEWIEPIVFVMVVSSLMLCAVAALTDLVPLYQQRRARQLRVKHKGLTLPGDIFNLSFCDYALLEYAEQSKPHAIRKLIKLEFLFRRFAVQSRPGTVAEFYSHQVQAQPRLLDWVLRDDLPEARQGATGWWSDVILERARFGSDGSYSRLLSALMHSNRVTLAHEDENEDYGAVPSIQLIATSKRGALLHWLCEVASPALRNDVRDFVYSLQKLILARKHDPRKALIQRLL
eukprot:3504894-Prymnesium_polylepis.1